MNLAFRILNLTFEEALAIENEMKAWEYYEMKYGSDFYAPSAKQCDDKTFIVECDCRHGIQNPVIEVALYFKNKYASNEKLVVQLNGWNNL